MKKKIYLAGAMGCYGKNSVQPLMWRQKAKELLEDSFSVIDPTYYYNYGYDEHKTEKEIMRFDMRKVLYSYVILVNLKDLDKSLGTSDEILLAYLNNIPVIGFNTENTVIHPWKIEQIDRIEIGKTALFQACDYIINYYL
mgnify:CR=1 FL=1